MGQGVPTEGSSWLLERAAGTMSPTRGSDSGGTTNLNRKQRRRPSTSPGVGRRRRPSLEALETRQLLSTYVVTNTGTMEALIRYEGHAAARPSSIPTRRRSQRATSSLPSRPRRPRIWTFLWGTRLMETEASILAPRPGRSSLPAPCPPSLNTVTIDGYSEAEAGVPFRYPGQLSLAVQTLSVLGSPTGGTFTLTSLLTSSGQNDR